MRTDGTGTFALPAALHDGDPISGSGDSAYYPWQESGLMSFQLQGTTAANAHLVTLPPLITHTAADSVAYSPTDGGALMGRSVLFPSGNVYVSNGTFWRQDAAAFPF
jgi:hypothetical protein